jgi:hypothetical protein
VFFGADIVGVSTGGTERVRVDASGNVGIGTSSPAQKLHVNGSGTVYTRISNGTTATTGLDIGVTSTEGDSIVFNRENTALRFGTNGTERARIDSSGNLLVGTTSTGSEIGRLTVKQGGDADSGGLRLIAPNSSNAWAVRTGSDNALYFGYNGTSKANINSSTGAYSALSDARLKVNVTDSAKGLSVVTALRPVEYQMKDDSTGANQIGLIAQEVLEILPEVVSVPATDDYFYGMNYSGVVPVLIKAIQELNAKVDAQAAEIAALKGQA